MLNEYQFTQDKNLINVEEVYQFLACQSDWAKNIPKENNPADRRMGLFPLYQLSELVVAEFPPQTLPVGAATVTKDELLQIVRKHALPSKRKEEQGLVMENLDDPMVSDPTAEETSIRIGTRNEVREFARLSAKLGLFSERAQLIQKPQLQVDATINMSHGTPEQLATHLVREIEQLSPVGSHVLVAGV